MDNKIAGKPLATLKTMQGGSVEDDGIISECFQVKRALTSRLRNSAIPYMQRLLNEKERRKREISREITNYQPVNNGLYWKSVSLRD